MTTLRIALAQIRQSADIDDNRAAIMQAVDECLATEMAIREVETQLGFTAANVDYLAACAATIVKVCSD